MPRNTHPRLVPLRSFTPGTAFTCPPGGLTEKGIFLEMLGGDAKVQVGDRTHYWSSETLVYRGSPSTLPRPVVTKPVSLFD